MTERNLFKDRQRVMSPTPNDAQYITDRAIIYPKRQLTKGDQRYVVIFRTQKRERSRTITLGCAKVDVPLSGLSLGL